MENHSHFFTFATLVKAMRKAQNGFFSAPPKSQGRENYLQLSKDLESQVDHYNHSMTTGMELETYKLLVRQMRLWQSNYFKSSGSLGKQHALNKAKELEKQLDKFVLPFDGKGNPVVVQVTMF